MQIAIVEMSSAVTPPQRRGASSRGSSASIDAYKCSEAIFLEEVLRKAIRRRVIDIGVRKAHSLVRQRMPSMAGRMLSSIYSLNDAGPAISLKRLLATASALDIDPLATLLEALQKRHGVRASIARVNYANSLRKIREDLNKTRARGQRRKAFDHPTLFDIEVAA